MIVELCLTSCCTPTKCCAHFSTPIAAEHSSSNSFLRKPGIVQSLTEEITSPKQSRYSFSAHRRSPSIPLEKRFVIYDIKIDVKIVLKSIDLSVLELLHTNTRMSTQFERHAGLFRAGRWGGNPVAKQHLFFLFLSSLETYLKSIERIKKTYNFSIADCYKHRQLSPA